MLVVTELPAHQQLGPIHKAAPGMRPSQTISHVSPRRRRDSRAEAVQTFQKDNRAELLVSGETGGLPQPAKLFALRELTRKVKWFCFVLRSPKTPIISWSPAPRNSYSKLG